MAASKLASIDAWARWAEHIAGMVDESATPDQVSTRLMHWQTTVEDDADITSTLYTTILQADMAGQLFVRAVEVPEVGPQRRGLRLDDARPSFMRLSFREALAAFLERGLVTPEEFQALSDVAKLRAFTATRLAGEQMVRRAQELLTRHLEEGGTLQGFAQGIRAEEVRLGVTPSDPHYVENVMRTNVQVAYGQGRLQQLEHPDVMAARPFVEYRTAQDTRVRPRHAALDGVVFDRSSDDGWRRFAPPLGYQCRCSLVTLRPKRVDRSRVRYSGEIDPTQAGADPGWAGPGSV